MTTAKMKISEFWQLPAVQAFVKKLRDLWDGPEGVKAVFEDWLAHPENRPKITFGYEAPDPESDETRGFFAQLKQTLLAGLNTIFGDIDFFGSLLAPIIAGLGTDPEAGFQGIIDKITETLQTVESAFNTADEAIDTFFENFNADTVGPLMDEWAAALGAKLDEWSAGLVESFRTLWALVGGIWQLAWDEFKQVVSDWWANLTTDWGVQSTGFHAAIDLNLGLIKTLWDIAWAGLQTIVTDWWSGIRTNWIAGWARFLGLFKAGNEIIKTTWGTAWAGLQQIVTDWWESLKANWESAWALFHQGVDLGMVLLNIMWQTGWESITTAVSDAWTAIKDTMENLFGGFGDWVQERVNDVGRGVVAIANSIIDVVNAIVAAINKPIRAWNDLSFGVGRIGRSFTYPTGVGLDGITTATKWFGFPGFDVKTTNLPTLSSLSKIGYGGGGGRPNENIAMLATGGLALGPTMAMIGEREPEAVLRMDQLRDFAGVGDAGGKPDLHLHIENAYGIDNLVDQLNEAWLDGRLRGLQDQLAGVG